MIRAAIALGRGASPILAIAALASCGSPPPPPAPGPTVVAIDPIEAGLRSAPPAEAPSPCAAASGDRCVGSELGGDPALLDARIERANKSVIAASFTDAHMLAELARLELLRDSAEANDQGESDAARAKRNAMRAVAVDRDLPESRLVLAMALGRSLLGARLADDPAAHRVRLHLIEMLADSTARATGAAQGFASAAAEALRGYVALETGDLDRARASFQSASDRDPRLVSAWMGLGDVARAGADFEAAALAYRRAGALSPNNAGIAAALVACEAREVLALQPAPPLAALAALGPAGLAGESPPPVACSMNARHGTAGPALCDGIDALLRASSPAQHLEAAQKIVAAAQDVLPLCETRDPACGPHVAPALAAAARSFERGGQIAKAIVTGRLLVQRSGSLPEGDDQASIVVLENADRYYSLGILDQAATHYDDHVRLVGAGAESPSARRALLLHAALGQPLALERLGPAGSEPSTDRRSTSCQRFVACAIRRLAAEAGWSGGVAGPL